jgi:RNA polymerase sigma-70 factor (ECF subfamily)
MHANPPFDDLVELHSAEIHRYLWRMLSDPHDAEDVLQETYLRAFRAYPRLRPGSNARAWLYKIATNTARTFAGRRNKLAMRNAPLEDFHAGDAPTPAEIAAQNESLAAVLSAVDALPHKQRAAFMLRQYQGMDYAEIAAALACSEDAARANVYQAGRKIKAQIGNW